jgi:hypothetical protein
MELLEDFRHGGRLPLSSPSSGVILRSHREYLRDTIMMLNKAPSFAIRDMNEEDILQLTRLSMGPRSLYLGGDS